MARRLKGHRGERQGGSGSACENHAGVDATYHVGVIGTPVTQLWLLCDSCTLEVTRNVDRVIAARVKDAI